jgi:aerobic C4-dicarboxylate transport protein
MSAVIATEAPPRVAKPWYKILYVQVLIAILIGVLVGWKFPHFATNDWIKALGDGFIKLIKMLIAPIIFCTVVSGISHIQDARKVGRVGVKALVYFEVVSSFALMIGLVMGNLIQVGRGLAVTPDAAAVAKYVKEAEAHKSVDFILNIIPDSVVGALARGDILQVLLFAILFGFALMALGERGHRLRDIIDDTSHAVFGVIAIVMKAAPFGAFGAMAYTVGAYGPSVLGNLIGLIVLFYATAGLFVVVVLGLIARVVAFNIFKFIAYIKDELLIVLGTSSSESALPQLMEKLERLGCSKSVVGLVVPTGYSFNLDGTNIYMTLATLFIAQALGVDADLEGRQRRHRCGIHYAGGNADGCQSGPGAGDSDRVFGGQVHERGSCAHQHHRQRHRHGVRFLVGGRTRSRQAARQSQPDRRHIGSADGSYDRVAVIRIKTARFCRAVFRVCRV